MRALSEQEIREIIRTNGEVFEAIAKVEGQTAHEITQRVTAIVFAHEGLLNSVAAVVSGRSPAEVAGVGALRWVIAAGSLGLTQAAHPVERLINIGLEEFARLAFDGDLSDRLVRLLLGGGSSDG